jgi:cobalamin biosynthesis protein CbiG
MGIIALLKGLFTAFTKSFVVVAIMALEAAIREISKAIERFAQPRLTQAA